MEYYKPRCVKDGKWDLYFNKAKLKATMPNLINMCYGRNGENTRTFTWQSALTDEGYIKWRKYGELKWNKKATEKSIITHYDTDATLHRVVLNDLEVGEYEYCCGEEGAYSDVAVFEVKKFQQTANESNFIDDRIKVLWTTDCVM